jgi:hypothetical protein
MTSAISEEEFASQLRSIQRSAFRWETLDAYAVGSERADFDLFLDGHPEPPPWQDWLTQVAEQTRQGKSVSRVRVLAEPPTSYQRWMMWAQPWYDRAREEIRFIRRSRAEELRLPLGIDWWLLDDERLILMYFTASGEIAGKILTTEPGILARHREWRDLAVANAIAAEEVAAA